MTTSEKPETTDVSALTTDEAELITALRNRHPDRAERALARLHDGALMTAAPVEYIVAYAAIGRLVEEHILNPVSCDFETGTRTGLPYCAQVIADTLAEVIEKHGWEGSMRELIHYAAIGTPAGWKSIDLSKDSDQDGGEE